VNEQEHLSDEELLNSLRLDYFQALQSEDYYRIQNTIVPQFRERFAKYYDEYEETWKDVAGSRVPVKLAINPTERQQAELGWIELVLKGQIDLAL
jgi:hypothetical protein